MHFRHNEWVHVNCALWSSEVYEEVDGSLQNVGQALTRGLKLNCTLCSKKGASIGKNTTFQGITIFRFLSLTSGLGPLPFCAHFRFGSNSGLGLLPEGSLQNVGQALTRGLKLNCTLCTKKGASIGKAKASTFQGFPFMYIFFV